MVKGNVTSVQLCVNRAVERQQRHSFEPAAFWAPCSANIALTIALLTRYVLRKCLHHYIRLTFLVHIWESVLYYKPENGGDDKVYDLQCYV